MPDPGRDHLALLLRQLVWRRPSQGFGLAGTSRVVVLLSPLLRMGSATRASLRLQPSRANDHRCQVYFQDWRRWGVVLGEVQQFQLAAGRTRPPFAPRIGRSGAAYGRLLGGSEYAGR